LLFWSVVDPRFKQLKFLKSGQIATAKAELETRMLLSDGQDGREKPPDATKKHKSINPLLLTSYLNQRMTQIEILLLEKNLNSILLKRLFLVKLYHFSGGRTMPSAFLDWQ